jgi:hypothetical protein
MRSLRRPSQDQLVRADGAPSDILLVPSQRAASESGNTALPGSGGQASTMRFHLRNTEGGLVIRYSEWTGSGASSQVSWATVEYLSPEEYAPLPDGSPGQMLEIGVAEHEQDWLDGEHPKKFIAPAPELGLFLEAVDAEWGLDALPGDAGPQVAVDGTVTGEEEPHLSPSLATQPRRVRVGSDRRHGLGHRRLGAIAVGLLAMVLLAGSASASFNASAGGANHGAGSGEQAFHGGNGAQAALAPPTSNLPAASAAPAPAPPSLAGSAPLQSHEIFGYAPYWTLPESSGFDVQDLTTLAYFSVDANPDGTLDQSGAGWNGYESQDLADLVTRSHAAGDRVVLTVTCFSQSSLNAITSNPAAAGNLSSALIAAVSAKNLDGVNFDFEGEGSADRNGLTALITQVSNALHGANPHWQVTMATYASAAADSSGFYDVAALAPALDGFFVMAYDMNNRTSPSATSPLVGGGFNDTEALQQFTAAVPPSKVILGVPYYGYDWPTTDGSSTAQATGGESPLSDSVIAASGHPTYWDPTTQTAWTSYQVGTQWHETYFDDPTSLALKAQLADSFHIAGLGIWALGMDGNDPAMLAALLGSAPAAKDLQTGPTSTAPGVPAGTGFTSTGVWNGSTVALTPLNPPASVGTVQYVGTLTGVQTTAPTLACLETGPPIDVWTFSALPGVYVAVATQPQDCAQATWTFTPPAAPPVGTSDSTTTTEPPTTTTTTSASPTTTTSSTVPPTTTTTSSTVPPTTTTTTG